MPPSTTRWCRRNARRSRAIASSRSRPHATILAIIESKSGGIRSPSRTPASTRIPLPAGRRRRASRPGAGANPFSGSSAFSRASIACPETVGGVPVSRPPCGDVQLQLHQVQPGGRLGHRMLDLQPGVDLHELEAAGFRVDQELHRAGVAVAGGGAKRTAASRIACSPPDPAPSTPTPRAPSGAGAAGCSRGADRPCGAVAVGDHLDLDVTRGRYQLLKEDRGVAERKLRLGACRRQRGGELVVVADHPDPTAAAADAAFTTTG